MIDEKTQVATALLEDASNEAATETARLEKFTDRILAKLASVITLSGVLTFISTAFVSMDGKPSSFVQFYLAWVFPYLVIGIGLWIFTMKASPAIIAKQVPVMRSTDPSVMLTYREARFEMHKGVCDETHRIYQRTRKLFGVSLAFIVAYICVYTASFYLYVFGQLPSTIIMVFVTIIVLLLIDDFRRWYSGSKDVVNVNVAVKLDQRD